MTYTYDLTLGLPHTNHRLFAEQLMLKFAGHFQWQSIAAAAALPLSSLRTADGGEVYASFYYIETIIPEGAPLESFRLDDTVRFTIALRAFKNMAFEGLVRFDRPERLNDTTSPYIRFANIFITPEQGNSRLRVAPPAQADFHELPRLPNEENPYRITQAASESGSLGLIDEQWTQVLESTHSYPIDVDRDTNGAGLVYFANYVAFMDTAERHAIPRERERSLRHRRIAYYGNAAVDDTLTIGVTVFRSEAHPQTLGFRYTIRRREDGGMICLSEAIKALA
jgi:probable biosynthetic protein (TIGR04098 family)